MTKIRKLLDVLTKGSPDKCKVAKIEIRKLFQNEKISPALEQSANTVFEYIDRFDSIEETKNKLAFLAGLDLFYFVLSGEYFERLKKFTLKTIQSPNGHIREAIRKTSEWLLISLSERMKPFVYPAGKELTSQQKKDQVTARKQYRLKENNRVKYINSMKPSVEKSLQMLLSRLTDFSKDAIDHPKQVLAKRKEIRKKLSFLIDKYAADLTF